MEIVIPIWYIAIVLVLLLICFSKSLQACLYAFLELWVHLTKHQIWIE